MTKKWKTQQLTNTSEGYSAVMRLLILKSTHKSSWMTLERLSYLGKAFKKRVRQLFINNQSLGRKIKRDQNQNVRPCRSKISKKRKNNNLPSLLAWSEPHKIVINSLLHILAHSHNKDLISYWDLNVVALYRNYLQIKAVVLLKKQSHKFKKMIIVNYSWHHHRSLSKPATANSDRYLSHCSVCLIGIRRTKVAKALRNQWISTHTRIISPIIITIKSSCSNKNKERRRISTKMLLQWPLLNIVNPLKHCQNSSALSTSFLHQQSHSKLATPV